MCLKSEIYEKSLLRILKKNKKVERHNFFDSNGLIHTNPFFRLQKIYVLEQNK